jgi:uncharacterized phage-associated protein
MAYSPRIVANALLWDAKKRNGSLTHMKLQKLVFFMHAWSLALYGAPLVTEKPQAWQYGPVFPSIYHELKSFGSGNITSMLAELNTATGQFVPLVPNPQDERFWSLLKRVWDRYGGFSAGQLSALTHESGGPWERAYKNAQREIPDDWIANHYRHKLPATAGV